MNSFNTINPLVTITKKEIIHNFLTNLVAMENAIGGRLQFAKGGMNRFFKIECNTEFDTQTIGIKCNYRTVHCSG